MVSWNERRSREAVWVAPDPEPLNASIYFFTRRGGVSSPPFDSLNTSAGVGDDGSAVAENLGRIRHALAENDSAWVRQVHGTEVVRVSESGFAGEADALATDVSGLPLVVGVADCMPLILVGGGEVAIAHSGWRGTYEEIARSAVAAMSATTRVSNLAAYIGPCIRECCYEVSGELAEKFRDRFGPGVIRGDRNLSLPTVVEQSLRGAGVENVYDLGLCTGCRGDLFYSHRVQKPATGRMLAAVMLR